MSRYSVLAEVWEERERQEARWGEQNHPDVRPVPGANNERDRLRRKHDEYRSEADAWKQVNAARVAERNEQGEPRDRNCYWDGILLEEVFEALAEEDPAKLRAELIQVAAVAAAWVEAIDRRIQR